MEMGMEIEIENKDGLEYLKTIENDSIDLVLTDPPYIISKESGMNNMYNQVKSKSNQKTKEQLQDYQKNQNEKGLTMNEKQKENYLEYGSVYGKKYAVKTDYGDWDRNFTIDILHNFIKQFYHKLKKGGTIIIFFDLWKIGILKELLESCKFKQIRMIEWIKTNPQPLNSKINYLTNCREVALTAVKGGKPIFNSSYDNGIYYYPLQGGKTRTHPTQKSLKLFEELIKKHSKEQDLILDTFLGSGTTLFACKNTNRRFKGCEISKEYFDLLQNKITK